MYFEIHVKYETSLYKLLNFEKYWDPIYMAINSPLSVLC